MTDPRSPSGPALSRRSFLVVAAGGRRRPHPARLRRWRFLVDRLDPSTDGAGAAGPADTTGGGRALIVVELDGGNDGLSSLVPADGRYRDARPTIAVPEGDVVPLTGVSEAGLHPALAPLVPLWTTGQLAAVRGVGFPDPDRSHFVSMDRWWRADGRRSAPGWLAGWLASLPADAGALAATGLNGGAPQLAGSDRLVTTLVDPAGFRFRSPALAAGPARPLRRRQHASDGERRRPHRAGPGRHGPQRRRRRRRRGPGHRGRHRRRPPAGVAVHRRAWPWPPRSWRRRPARPSWSSPAGASTPTPGRCATTSASVADVATGIAGYFSRRRRRRLRRSLAADDHSEFGRRVAENGSGGTDHGAASTTFLAGPVVAGGLQAVGRPR